MSEGLRDTSSNWKGQFKNGLSSVNDGWRNDCRRSSNSSNTSTGVWMRTLATEMTTTTITTTTVITTDIVPRRVHLPRLVTWVWLSGVAGRFLCGPAVMAEELPQSPAVAEFSLRPSATGQQLVRVSLPLRPGQLAAGQAVNVRRGNQTLAAAIRPLTFHANETEPRFVRRALVTFPFYFEDEREVFFALHPATTPAPGPSAESPPSAIRVELEAGDWVLTGSDGLVARARPVWPESESVAPWQQETIEDNQFFQWQRWRQCDEQWCRVVEARCDVVGQVVLVAHLQRREAAGDWCPAFGWDMTLAQNDSSRNTSVRTSLAVGRRIQAASLVRVTQAPPWKRIPVASLPDCPSGRPLETPRGRADTNRSARHHPLSLSALHWRRSGSASEVCLATSRIGAQPSGVSLPRPHLHPRTHVWWSWRDWDELYDTGSPLLTPAEPLLSQLRDYHVRAVVASAAVGSDWGNVTSYSDGAEQGSVFGMNRLNHCPAIFFEAMRTGNDRLADTAIAWCDNFYDLSIWWGPRKRVARVTTTCVPMTKRHRKLIGISCGGVTNRHPSVPKATNCFCWRTRRPAIHACRKHWRPNADMPLSMFSAMMENVATLGM